MTKRSILTLFSLVIAFLLLTAGCADNGQEDATNGELPEETEDNGLDEPTAPGEVVTLSLAHHWPPQNIYGQNYQYFADLVYEMSDGEIVIEIYPANSLITVTEMYEGVLDGTADMGYSTSSFLSSRMPELSFFELPGAFDVYSFEETALAIQPELEAIFEDHGLVYLWAQDPGDIVLSSTEPVEQFSDMEGLRVRDYGIWVGKAIEEMGAVQTTIPPADLSVALERGTVDAAYATWTFADGYSLYEQAEHITWFGVSSMWVGLFMNQNSWNQLTPEQQEIIREAGIIAQAQTVELVEDTREAFIEKSEAAGATHYEFSDEDREEIYRQVEPIFDEAREVIRPLGIELLEKLEGLR